MQRRMSLYLTLGMIIISSIVIYVRYKDVIPANSLLGLVLKSSLHYNEAYFTRKGETVVADVVAERIRIFCYVITMEANHNSRAVAVRDTWGKRCNGLLFVSDVDNATLPARKLNNTEPGYAHLWGKTKAMFQHAYSNHLTDYDWFFKGDDDTHMVPENLRLLLAIHSPIKEPHAYSNHLTDYDWFFKGDDDTHMVPENLRLLLAIHSPKEPVWFGCKYRPRVWSGYMQGGAGYVLSQEAVKRFVEQGLTANDTHKCNTKNNKYPEDGEIGLCLQSVGVFGGDTRDALGAHRMQPVKPEKVLPDQKPVVSSKWYPMWMGPKCCSDYIISFHKISPDTMYMFDYILYRVRVYGIYRPFTLLAAHAVANVHTGDIMAHAKGLAGYIRAQDTPDIGINEDPSSNHTPPYNDFVALTAEQNSRVHWKTVDNTLKLEGNKTN